jgi:hypothetical protein
VFFPSSSLLGSSGAFAVIALLGEKLLGMLLSPFQAKHHLKPLGWLREFFPKPKTNFT